MNCDLSKSVNKFLFNEISTLSFLGIGRLKSVYSTEDDAERTRWRERVKQILRVDLYRSLPVAHPDRIQAFIDETRDEAVLQNGRLSFGVAQKLLNLFLKYAWALGWVPEPADCPIDSRILKHLGLQNLRWSKVSRTEYEKVMSCIDGQRVGKSRAVWELEEWEGLRPAAQTR